MKVSIHNTFIHLCNPFFCFICFHIIGLQVSSFHHNFFNNNSMIAWFYVVLRSVLRMLIWCYLDISSVLVFCMYLKHFFTDFIKLQVIQIIWRKEKPVTFASFTFKIQWVNKIIYLKKLFFYYLKITHKQLKIIFFLFF